jgi:OOP family OmpA-OmpF porin
MIKNVTKVVLSVAAFGLATAASAQSMSNTYVGVGVGSSNIKLNATDVAGNTGKDESDSGYKIFGGYRFNQTWAAEAAYTNLGDATVSFPGASAKGEASSWSLAAVGTLPLSGGFSLLGKLGVTENKFKTSGSAAGANATKNKTDMLWGIGASYAFSPRVSARLEWEDYGKFGDQNTTGRAKADMLSVSVVYGF